MGLGERGGLLSLWQGPIVEPDLVDIAFEPTCRPAADPADITVGWRVRSVDLAFDDDFFGALSSSQRLLTEFEKEVLQIGDAAGFVDDAACEGVECFDPSTRDAVLAEIEDLLLGFAWAAGKAFEFSDAAPIRHADPSAQALFGAFAASGGPHSLECVLEHVNHRQVAVGRQQFLEVRTPAGAQVLLVAKQVVSLAFEECAAFRVGLRFGATADLANDLAEVCREMEFVEDDVRCRQIVLHCGSIRAAAVDADGKDTGFLIGAQFGPVV